MTVRRVRLVDVRDLETLRLTCSSCNRSAVVEVADWDPERLGETVVCPLCSAEWDTKGSAVLQLVRALRSVQRAKPIAGAQVVGGRRVQPVPTVTARFELVEKE